MRWVLRLLSGGSALVHAALCVYCIVKSFQTGPDSPYVFAFYRSRVSGERVAASTVSFVDSMQTAAKRACPANVALVRLLETEAPGQGALGLGNMRQTWIADRFGDDGLNGFWLLVVIFAVSAAAQCVFVWRTLEESALETFRQPVLLRWVEYAATSPLQVVLVASCVMVRDVHTLLLLTAAQFACVLLGYSLEFAVASADLEETIDLLPPQSTFSMELSVGKVVSGPKLEAHLMASQESKASVAWTACFVSALVLHVAIWSIILDQLGSVEKESLCHVGSDEWRDPLRFVIIGQCVLFSLFALVPLAERIAAFLGEGDAGVRLLYCSVAYSVLGVVAKSMLVASYVSFMQQFPFATRAG
jgi:hypothetical protein